MPSAHSHTLFFVSHPAIKDYLIYWVSLNYSELATERESEWCEWRECLAEFCLLDVYRLRQRKTQLSLIEFGFVVWQIESFKVNLLYYLCLVCCLLYFFFFLLLLLLLSCYCYCCCWILLLWNYWETLADVRASCASVWGKVQKLA